jgi:sporulation protein YlmC with PRC-barrel domain
MFHRIFVPPDFRAGFGVCSRPFGARNPAQRSHNVPEPAMRPPGYFGVSQEAKTMTKTLLALATASTLSLSMAMAQSPTPPASADTAAPKASMAADSGSVIAAQKPDEWLATKFRGTSVLGTDGAKIGSVDDILFERNGSIKALVIGVGGFLGIGAKEVAVPFKQFQVVSGTDGKSDVLTLAMTKDQLADAQDFKPYEPPRPAVTPGPAGAGGGMRPPMAPSSR